MTTGSRRAHSTHLIHSGQDGFAISGHALLKDYEAYLRPLLKFFGGLQLSKISYEQIREYQSKRSRTCGPNKINSEVGIFRRIMQAVDAGRGKSQTFTRRCSQKRGTSRAQ